MVSRLKVVAKLARDGELDHRAGQLKSAEARATVAIAAADAMSRSLGAKPQAGWLGSVLGTNNGLSDVALQAASQSHITLGGLARDRGDLAIAEQQYNAALESARRMRRGELATGVAMLELGHNRHLQGRQNDAADLLRQAHPLLVQTQGEAYVPLDMYLLGLALVGMQRWDEALAVLQETEGAYAQRGLTKGILDCRLARTDILIRTGHADDGEHLATETAAMAEQLGEPIYMAQSRWHLARIKRAAKRPDEAISLIREAITLYQQAGDEWHRAQILMAMAEIQGQEGRIEEADRTLDEAARIAADIGSPYLQADCIQLRATLRLQAGRIADGRALLEEAKEKFAEQGRADQVRASLAVLDQLRSKPG
jgi:tetratricopeptide (TPR) repeat protein